MSLPSNVHISSHPCLQVKLSQLRSKSTHMAKTRRLVREMTNILGVEALAASLSVIKRKEKASNCLFPFIVFDTTSDRN